MPSKQKTNSHLLKSCVKKFTLTRHLTVRKHAAKQNNHDYVVIELPYRKVIGFSFQQKFYNYVLA